jgi:tetratricopeptide (TPR) repeat protein
MSKLLGQRPYQGHLTEEDHPEAPTMAASPESEHAPPREIDITKRHAPRPWQTRTVGCLWSLFPFGLLGFLAWQRQAIWLFLAILGLAVLLIIVVGGWQLIVGNGLLTWMRQAQTPEKALLRGDAAGAERAFITALARAQQFSPDDSRRGSMLVELASYLKKVGRCSEAKALYEEAVAILGQRWKSNPFAYFVALNNLAAYLIDVHDHAAAQRILEKLLDLTLVWSKGGFKPAATGSTVHMIEFILHINLVVLFRRMEELTLAADHLEEADALFGKLSQRHQRQFHDHYRGVRALLLHAQGQFAQAASELDKAHDPDHLLCLAVRAKLHLARGDFVQADQLLRKYLDREGKVGPLHRPELRDQMLDLAESLFGQGKHDEAFTALQEARDITRDFALPAISTWRKTLVNWLPRAQQLVRTDDMAWLEDDLHTMATAPEQAITILPRFRIRPQHKHANEVTSG